MVETVDVITPIVNDPYIFGAICAANSVSDIYAMGGNPLTALAILGYASCDFSPTVIKKLLKGAIEKLKEAGVCLIGGHSIEDSEFKFGFAISGVIDKNKILRINKAKTGDILILTKQLGTGVLTSAVKLGRIKEADLKPVITSMLMLNKTASRAAILAGAEAATDITGFGLIGHAVNMAKHSGVNLVISYKDVPLMKGVKGYIKAGIIPGGAKKTLEFFGRDVVFSNLLSEVDKLALADPQTSGGLLIALSEKGLKRFDQIARRKKMPYWIIGRVIKGRGKVIIE